MTTQRNKTAKIKTASQLARSKKSAPSNVRPVSTRARRTQKRKDRKKPGAIGKTETIIELLKKPEGATIADLCSATGWQAHSVRGLLSGVIKKRLGLPLKSEKTDAGRIYRISE